MNISKNVLWITRTAIFIALLVVLQFATAQLGNTYITGSAVNLILIVSVMTCGLPSGATVACISPVFARLLGIGTPFWTLVPFIALGNLVLVLLWRVIGAHAVKNKAFYGVALVAAAIGKFAALYAGVVMIAIPFLLELNEKQTQALSLTFSFPQLVTASIGGALALAVLPLVKRAIKN